MTGLAAGPLVCCSASVTLFAVLAICRTEPLKPANCCHALSCQTLEHAPSCCGPNGVVPLDQGEILHILEPNLRKAPAMKSVFVRNMSLMALAICATAAAHAIPLSLMVKGTISSGYDYSGEFGASGLDLAGKSVEIKYIMDSSDLNGSWTYNSAANQQTVTVGGVSRQFNFSATDSSSYYEYYNYNYSYSQTGVSNNLSLYGNQNYYYDYYGYYGYYGYYYNNYDQFYHGAGGQSNGSYMYSDVNLYSYTNAFNPPTSGNTSWYYEPTVNDNSYMSFYSYNYSNNYYDYYGGYYGYNGSQFQSNITSIALGDYQPSTRLRSSALQANAVPEPASAALVAVALLAAFGVQRRRPPRTQRAQPANA